MRNQGSRGFCVKGHLCVMFSLVSRHGFDTMKEDWMLRIIFVQKRLNKGYHPSNEAFRHVDEMLKLMSVLTNDSRFEDIIQELIARILEK